MSTISSFTFNAREGRQTHQHSHGHIIIVLTQTFYIRFLDKPDDTYYYCFKDEGFHFIYHRFLPEDYADFGF